MADYRWRTDAHTLCYGRGDQLAFTVNPTRGWTYEDGTGSRTFDYNVSFVNGYGMGDQYINCDIHTTWSVNYDHNNRMRVTVTQKVNRVNASSYNSGVNYPYFVLFRNANQGGNQIGNTIWYGLSDWFNYNNVGEQTFTWTIDPHTDSEFNTLYICNVSTTGGHTENDCDAYVDKGTIGIQFHNSRDWIYDEPRFTYKNCRGLDNGARLHVAVDYGAVKPGGQDRITAEIAKDPEFTNIIYTASSSSSDKVFNAAGLQPNTRYYVRYTATNGDKTKVEYCEFVTLVFNTLSDPASDKYNRGSVRLAIQNGAGVYDPTTTVYYRRCNSGDEWTQAAVTTTKTVQDITITGLQEQTCYEVQAKSVTQAGEYWGNIVSFTTPEKNIAHAFFTEIEPALEPGENIATAHICYKYDSNTTPFKVRMYYRVKNGYDTNWQYTDDVTFNELEGTYCFDLEDLWPNQTVYEAYLRTETDEAVWTGEISEFITPLMEMPDNCTCDNFQYLLDLLCQAIKPLYTGNKTIYANPTSKEQCDPYSDNPTLATLWSRILRFDHAAACLLCDALYLITIKGGEPDQYFAGEVGWQTLSRIVEENSEILVTSDTIRTYIDEQMHEVWHYHSDVDYLVGLVSELPDDATDGEDAIVADTSERYVYDETNDEWVLDEDFEVDDFSVFHINKAYDSSIGHVKAHSAYYYFEGTWNDLDADTTELEKAVAFLEAQKVVLKQSVSEDNIFYQVNDENFDYTGLPSGQRVVAFVEEAIDRPYPQYHTVEFNSRGGTTVPMQVVLDGATAVEPADPVMAGATFLEWREAGQSTAFDFTDPIEADTLLEAEWDTVMLTVTFNPDGGTMTDPTTQYVAYGSPIVPPTPPTKAGYVFNNWTLAGEAYNVSTPVVQDITLTAAYSVQTVTVSFNPDNGGATTTQTIPVNTTATRPTDPTKAGYNFTGWYDENDVLFDFTNNVTRNTMLTAKWTAIVWTVSFTPDGGTPVPAAQSVYDGNTAVEPTVTKTGYSFLGWFNNGTLFDFSTPVTSNLSLTARWEQLTFIVSFNSNGGSAVPDQTVPYGGTASAPATPTWAGHTFGAWQLNGSNYNFSTPVTEAITLDATWTLIDWTVTFDADGGSPAPQAQTVTDGQTATRPATDPAKQNYQFDNWLEQGSPYDFTRQVHSDLTLIAGYRRIWTVTFDSDGGSAVSAQNVLDGDTATQPADPTKQYYAFDGWILGGSLYDFSDPVVSDITLTATWHALHATVTFEDEGGTVVDTETVNLGDTVTQPADPTKTGYIFDGWVDTSTSQLYNFAQPVTGDLTLRMSFHRAVVGWTVSNDNGGSNSGTLYIGDTLSAPSWADQTTKYIKTWTDTATSTTVTFPIVLTESNVHSTQQPGRDYEINITGVYVNKAHATFDANGGSPTPADQYKKAGEKLDEPTDPTKSGYLFDGWEK